MTIRENAIGYPSNMSSTHIPTLRSVAMLNSRFPGLICLQCTGQRFNIVNNVSAIACASCGERYDLLDARYPVMLTGETRTSDIEISVQDRAALTSENLRYGDRWSREYRIRMRDSMLANVPLSGLILDDGCGAGLTFDGMADKDVIGIDISPNAVRLAGKRIDRVLVGDGMQIPFGDETFDTVIARGMLHHLPDYEKGIQEIWRVLRPGGQVIATDPNKTLLSTVPRAIAYKILRNKLFSDDHQNLCRQKVIAGFSRHFQIEDVSFRGYLAYPIAFPDVVNWFRFVPARNIVFEVLMAMDEILSAIPLIRSYGWIILVRARKEGAI